MRLSDFSLNSPICAVVHLDTQPPNVLQQVTLRPDKRAGDLIRLGETPGDEALCWIFLENVSIAHILGNAVRNVTAEGKEEWKVVPMIEKAA